MEPSIRRAGQGTGWIEVICGSMFSGKTEELIRRLKRARIARLPTATFKHTLERRFSDQDLVSHDESSMDSAPVASAADVLRLVGNAQVVGIDEGQFFDLDLVEACSRLAREGRRVIVAGLDQDYLGRPFEPIPQLMAIAEHVTKLHAVCVVCGASANHSQRIRGDGQRIVVGASDVYEPRCRDCFRPDDERRP